MACIGKTAMVLISIILCTPYLYAQQKMTNYTARWKKIDSLLLKKGLSQSALEEVDQVYALAKKEKQDAQLIKALLYQASIRQSTSENASPKILTQWQQEINTATEPVKSVLTSLLADKYLSYFQQHRWQLYDRTAVVHSNKEDVSTWGVQDFHEKIGGLYLASLKEENRLQQTSLEGFDAIIIKGNSRTLRPTLYDLLANRALDYFRNQERDIIKPAYAFELDDPHYFSSTPDFIRLKIDTKDSASLYHKALLIYQSLLAFHLKDTRPDALIDADIQRLQFVYQHAVMENKDSLYERSLTDMSNRFSQLPAAAQAAYLLAQLYATRAAAYKAADNGVQDSTGAKGAYIVAANICRQVLQQKDASEGRANCYNLLQQIEKKELKLSTEKVNFPELPFRTLVSYRNTGDAYFRLTALNSDLKKKLENRYDDKYWNELIAIKPLRSWNQHLPQNEDYQQHSAEIKVDALPVGEYILLASANADFSADKGPLAVQFFYVSAISYINNRDAYFILNRESGQPLAGASVQSWWNAYDAGSRSNKKVKAEQLMADKNGYVKFTGKTERQGNLQLDISYNNDRLFMNDGFYTYYREEDENETTLSAAAYEKANARVFFFTDRSIYRPGQTLYFKGIAVTRDFATKQHKVYGGMPSKVFLRNANGEEVDSLELTTNEYGAYTGKLILPQGVLNGEYTLIDEEMDGNTSFSVEEYKRPKFFVAYDTLKGVYRLNDSISITGSAQGYAGNAIDGAQVKYRVQRVARFIYPWLYWKWGYPRSSNMEISQGTATTDASGKFTIQFKAIPDRSVNPALEPIFDYQVSADITDLNGETRSGETTIPVAYKALQLKVILPETLAADSLKNISVVTQNLNGAFEPAQVNVYLYGLKEPGRLVRKRYWPQPDQFVMKEPEFLQYFPNDEYQQEADYRSWARDRIYLRKIDSTNSSGVFELPKSKLPGGWYAVEASTKDKYGEPVKDVQYIQLYEEKSNNLPAVSYHWSAQKNNTVEPGAKSVISVGSSASDVFLIQEIDRKKNALNDPSPAPENTPVYTFIRLNGKQDFSFPVTEADRGGFQVNHLFVKNNRFYGSGNGVNVPWTNKELQVSYETFRDKTLPGSEEKWKLKISGYKKEKLAAELLASMYDASLDQFKPHAWNVPSIWEMYSGYNNWTGNNCFNQVQSEEKYDYTNYNAVEKTYDYINAMNNGINEGRIRLRGVAAGVQVSDANLNEVAVTGYAAPKRNNSTAAIVVADKQQEGKPEEQDKEKQEPVNNQSVNTASTPVQIRKNFNETAFFFPDLKTDSAGNISFGFTLPEALTKWKFQALAYTKDLAFGYSARTLIAQKPLMVQPNPPRFMREGDKMEFSAKVVNLTDKELTGTVTLDLINTATNQPVDGWFRNMYPTQYFTAPANQSTLVKFSIDVPYQYNSAVSYRLVASAATAPSAPGRTDGTEMTDGEEASLPVLTNSLLVTESMPLPMRGSSAKHFKFEKLLQSGSSETLQQHALTVEFTTNPAWFAVQALPYLMEYPYECAEQTFNRYYANAMATKIANSVPRLKALFDQWKTKDTAALLSNLQKNPDLKAILLEETPWVLAAKNETQQKKNIALLFDMMRMNIALTASFDKLKQMQLSNGGFAWFKGGPDDRYITQYILAGIGHLKKLGAINASQQKDWEPVIKPAVNYLDQRIKEEYDNLRKDKNSLPGNNLSYTAVQYLYMRSFFSEYSLPGPSFPAVNYYRKQSQQFWLQQNKYMQGMIALSLFRSGDGKTAADIIKSLKQNAIVNEELGMYWKDNISGYYWHQAPVETQSLLIEAFTEISKDSKTVNDLKTWLLKQKQTQNWTTTRATAEACYALLLQGSDWLNATPAVEIKLGDKSISSAAIGTEAGTGYFRKTIDGPFVKPGMGDISVKIATAQPTAAGQPAWGAVYWQYFEQLDKITPAITPLQLNKKLFIEKNTDAGPVLEPIAENSYVKLGEKIKVRITLHVDRNMEYVHMKDMRASCLEPVNVLSGYKWQGGLGYYESTKDASTNFFFGWLPKGDYVFEYSLFVTHTGSFSNGITSIQCMYAPEFASHSEGIRINAEENK